MAHEFIGNQSPRDPGPLQDPERKIKLNFSYLLYINYRNFVCIEIQ